MTNTAQPNRVKLTQRLAETAHPPADGHKTIWDANLPGFGLRISSKGRRTWICMYRVARGPQVMESIATLAAMPSINDARDAARQSFEQARLGIHPVEQRKQRVPASPNTLAKLIEAFIREHHERRGSRAKTIYEARRLLSRALAYLGDKPVKDIGKDDILAMIKKLADTRINPWGGNEGGSLYEAAGVLVHLRTCLRFAVAENIIDADPTNGVRNPNTGKRERERVLSETEIKALWQVCDEIGYPYGPLLQLLLLTGQRCDEVGEMPWSELVDLDKRVWHLASERAKNRHAHDIHLSDLALEIINRLPRFDHHGDAGFVFSITGERPVSTYSYHKRLIDQRLATKLGKIEAWTIHDLRRSFATGMAELGIAPHVLDRCLNHVSGTIKGVARIYNRSQYAPERMAALDTWGRHIESLVYPERTNVVALRAG